MIGWLNLHVLWWFCRCRHSAKWDQKIKVTAKTNTVKEGGGIHNSFLLSSLQFILVGCWFCAEAVCSLLCSGCWACYWRGLLTVLLLSLRNKVQSNCLTSCSLSISAHVLLCRNLVQHMLYLSGRLLRYVIAACLYQFHIYSICPNNQII